MKRHLLLIAAAIATAAPAAFAEPAREAFKATFTYDRSAPAQDIYDSVLRQARKACETHGRRSLDMLAADRACAVELVDQVVARTSRTDIALLHLDRTGREVVAPRDLALLDR